MGVMVTPHATAKAWGLTGRWNFSTTPHGCSMWQDGGPVYHVANGYAFPTAALALAYSIACDTKMHAMQRRLAREKSMPHP